MLYLQSNDTASLSAEFYPDQMDRASVGSILVCVATVLDLLPRTTLRQFVSHRYCGRDVQADEIALIRQLIAEDPVRSRAELSRLICRALRWNKADGGLKDMSARLAMLCMHAASARR